jgi:hypothetical protein
MSCRDTRSVLVELPATVPPSHILARKLRPRPAISKNKVQHFGQKASASTCHNHVRLLLINTVHLYMDPSLKDPSQKVSSLNIPVTKGTLLPELGSGSVKSICFGPLRSEPISQRYGSVDPDPHQNFIDPQHCLLQMDPSPKDPPQKGQALKVKKSNFLSFSSLFTWISTTSALT